MATAPGITHQLRRGTSTQISVFVGAQAEPVFNTSNDQLVLCDGSLVGGRAVESAAVQTVLTQPTTILPTVAMVYVYSTVAVAIQLPSVLSYPLNQRLTVVDAGGNAGSAAITINTANSSESIQSTTFTFSTSTSLNINGGFVTFTPIFSTTSTSLPLRWIGQYRRT